MNGDKKKKGSSVGWVIFTVVLGTVLSAIGEIGSEALLIVIPIIAILIIIFVFRAIFKTISGLSKSAGERPARREPLEDRAPRRSRRAEEKPLRAGRDEADRPSIFRREPLEDKPISHQRELLPMDEYERQKRLNQLDNFLKNGTIDREEYRKLRARYER